MYRTVLVSTCLIIAALVFVACDEDTAAPPAAETILPLLDGEWTLRARAGNIPGTETIDLTAVFTTEGDSVFMVSGEDVFGGIVEDGRVALDYTVPRTDSTSYIQARFTVDEHGRSLQGRCSLWQSRIDTTQPFPGYVYGLPGPVAPSLDVMVAPSTFEVFQGSAVQFGARVDGWSGNDVFWSLLDESPGTLTHSGLYTAPAILLEPAHALVCATSAIDHAVRDTAVVDLVPPPPTCLDVAGEWEAHILIETADGFQDDHYDFANWLILQDECGLTLSDRGMEIDLDLIGGYATGTYEIPNAQYVYRIHFCESDTIRAGSVIEYRSLYSPVEPFIRPVRGFRRDPN